VLKSGYANEKKIKGEEIKVYEFAIEADTISSRIKEVEGRREIEYDLGFDIKQKTWDYIVEIK